MSAAQPLLAARLSALVRDVPDFPKPGIVFKDISPILADPAAFAAVVAAIADHGRDDDGAPIIDAVVGVESRGFIVGAPVAVALGAGFVPVRKEGKLPGPTYRHSYELEYGHEVLEVRCDAFAPGDRVLVVDDVLATGGTLAAAHALVALGGAQVAASAVLIELAFLSGRDRLGALAPQALLTV